MAEKKERPIVYEPHPVSPERKAALRKMGVQIIDAIYEPAEHRAKRLAQADAARKAAAEEEARKAEEARRAAEEEARKAEEAMRKEEEARRTAENAAAVRQQPPGRGRQ